MLTTGFVWFRKDNFSAELSPLKTHKAFLWQCLHTGKRPKTSLNLMRQLKLN